MIHTKIDDMMECTKKWHNYTPEMTVVRAKEKVKNRIIKKERVKKKKESFKLDANFLHEENVIANYFDIPMEILIKKKGKAHIVEARRIIWYFLYQFPELTQQIIGDRYGVHHSTVKHGLDKVDDLKIYEWYRLQLERIQNLIKQK